MSDYQKINKTIHTCETIDQLEVAMKLIPLLYEKTKDSADNFFLMLHADMVRDRIENK